MRRGAEGHNKMPLAPASKIVNGVEEEKKTRQILQFLHGAPKYYTPTTPKPKQHAELKQKAFETAWQWPPMNSRIPNMISGIFLN